MIREDMKKQTARSKQSPKPAALNTDHRLREKRSERRKINDLRQDRFDPVRTDAAHRPSCLDNRASVI